MTFKYIKENKQWIFSGIGVFVIGGFIAFFKFGYSQLELKTEFPNNKKAEQVTQVFPNQKKADSVTETEEEKLRRQLRQEHGVRSLAITENELRFSVAPDGVYGFAQSIAFHDSNFLQLEREFLKRIHFEFHKMSDGHGEIIVFVSPDVSTMLNRKDRPIGYPATLYNRMWAGASVIESIPLDALGNEYEKRTIYPDDEKILALDVKIIK